MIRAAAVHGEMTVRALLRRRLTLAILVGLPILFSFVARHSIGQSVRALVFGTSWAMSTAAFFATSASRQLEPRLRLAGWSRPALLAGRIGGLLVLGTGLVALFWIVVAVDHAVRSLPAVALDLAVTALVAVAAGTAIGTVIAKEMDVTPVLFLFAGLHAVVNPFDDRIEWLAVAHAPLTDVGSEAHESISPGKAHSSWKATPSLLMSSGSVVRILTPN